MGGREQLAQIMVEVEVLESEVSSVYCGEEYLFGRTDF